MNLKFTKKPIDKVDRLRMVLKYTKENVCVIGIWDQEGVESSNHITYRQLAMIHEYGNGHVPARPFLKNAVDAGWRKCNKLYRENIHLCVSGRLPTSLLYFAPSTFMVKKIKASFGSAKLLALSPATIKRRSKGSARGKKKPLAAKALLDTGDLRKKVDSIVIPKGTYSGFVNA